MRLYSDNEEENVKATRALDQWGTLGFVRPEQLAPLKTDVDPGVTMTRTWLRIVTFIFTSVVAGSFIGILYAAKILKYGSFIPWFILAVLAYGLAEYVIRRGPQKLYRFGIEEALIIGALFFCGIGFESFLKDVLGSVWQTSFMKSRAFMALIYGGLWALVYLRMGYRYAALAAIFSFIASAPFWSDQGHLQRCVVVILCALGAAFFEAVRKQSLFEYREKHYALFQAVLALTAYLALNVRLAGLLTWGAAHSLTASGTLGYSVLFYWISYVSIWVLPILYGWFSIRRRDRGLLWAAIISLLLTLATNKPYLGLPRYSWDPMILGVFLMGAALLLRRWILAGPNQNRSGFTVESLSANDKGRLAVLGTSSVLWGGGPSGSGVGHKPDFGGGRSGGGGASSGF